MSNDLISEAWGRVWLAGEIEGQKEGSTAIQEVKGREKRSEEKGRSKQEEMCGISLIIDGLCLDLSDIDITHQLSPPANVELVKLFNHLFWLYFYSILLFKCE